MCAIALVMAVAPAVAPAATFPFPSSTSSVVASTATGFLDDDEVGFFWSAARGDRVSETFTASKRVNRAIVNVQTPRNNANIPVTWQLEINGAAVGAFVVPSASPEAKQSLDVSFAQIAGPTYNVTLRILSEVGGGGGSHTFAYAGAFDHSLQLLDTIPPDTKITSALGGSTAAFEFSSSDVDLAGFQCSLDGGAFAACTSAKVYSGLKPGNHTLAARAVDDAGNPDPSPAQTNVAGADGTPAALKIAGVPRSLDLKRLRRGFRASVTPNEPAALDVTLAGTPRKGALAAAYELQLFSKSLGRSAGKRTIRVKPKAKLVGRARRAFRVRLRIVATDASGNRSSVTRTIRIKRKR